MAHFYGTLDGARGQASRLGNKNSGFKAVAASWDGAVEVTLHHDGAHDIATVCLRQWEGRGVNRELYSGPVDGEAPLGRYVVTLKSDQGPRKVETAATSFDGAASIVCNAENAPRSAVKSVAFKGLV